LKVCRGDYSLEQLNVWASAATNIQRWKDKIKLQYFLVSHVNKKLVGCGALENKDLIDLLYIHKDCQGLGVGNRILGRLISMARSQGIKVLKAEVSKTARHFFETNGFALVLEQSKRVDGIALNNYQMTKSID
jgi:putative acetyltransferase